MTFAPVSPEPHLSRQEGEPVLQRLEYRYVQAMVGEKVYVVDRVVTKPGRAREFVDAYVTEYVPGGRTRRMTLDRILVSPPIWWADEPNTITITWVVDGVDAWWDMTRRGRPDPELGRWWSRMDPMILDRTRSMAAAAEDVDGVCDV